jgi:Flp pilus assembly protein TadD
MAVRLRSTFVFALVAGLFLAGACSSPTREGAGTGSPAEILEQVAGDVARDDFQAAFDRLQPLATSHPDDPEVHYWLGVCQRELGRPVEAINHLLRTVELDDAHRLAHIGLATLFDDQSRQVEALPHMQRAVELEPGDPAMQFRLGVLQLRNGQLEPAIATLEETVRLAPDNADARWMLGRSHQLAGDIPQAIEQLEKAVELEPGHLATQALDELRQPE